MKIVWSEQARHDWVAYYRSHLMNNPEAARRMRRLVMAGVNRLGDFPRMGRPGQVAGSRELVIHGTPFLVVYDENPGRVEITHIRQERQNS